MSSNLDMVMKKITASTDHLTVEQLLTELSIVIERVSFLHTSWADLGRNDVQYLKDIEALLERDISPGLLQFVDYLAKNNWLTLLYGDTGKRFLAECQSHFSKVRQLNISTAVRLSEEMEQKFLQKVAERYGQDVHVAFDIKPELVAGFILSEPHRNVYDYSLRAHMRSSLKKYLLQNQSEVTRG